MRCYQANVIGEEILDYDLPVGGDPEQIGESGVIALYGGYDGATVLVGAINEEDAVEQIEKAFAPDIVTIDDLQNLWDEKAGLEQIEHVCSGFTRPRTVQQMRQTVWNALELRTEDVVDFRMSTEPSEPDKLWVHVGSKVFLISVEDAS
jgi:hypothetical protein